MQSGYIIEPKLDGVRCLAVVGDVGGCQLYNRQLRNITAAFPDVCAQIVGACPGVAMMGPLVLDGEVYVRGPEGHADFQLVQHRANRLRDVDAAVQAYPARYAAFDVLSSGRVDYKSLALVARKSILMAAAPTLAIATYTQEEADDLARCGTGEGLMLKALASRYVPGARSPDWLKLKWLREAEVYIGGVTWGVGRRADYFGGLLVGVYVPGDTHAKGRLTYVGTVGTGFTDEMLEVLTLRLRSLHTSVKPFAEADPGWDLAYYVQPVLRARVRFADYTRGRIMRFPRFAGLV